MKEYQEKDVYVFSFIGFFVFISIMLLMKQKIRYISQKRLNRVVGNLDLDCLVLFQSLFYALPEICPFSGDTKWHNTFLFTKHIASNDGFIFELYCLHLFSQVVGR